jgi:predicted nucleotidyltransferase
MPKSRPLINAIMPAARRDILSIMLMDPQRSWYVADLARHIGRQRSSLQRELVALSEAGILKHSQQGRMSYYQANTECPVFLDLQNLVAKTSGLVDVLRKAFEPFKSKIRCAFVFGSIAKSEESYRSDVDVMIIGTVTLREICTKLSDATQRLSREVNPITYSSEEFDKRLSEEHHFLMGVLEKPKLFIFGSPLDLEATHKEKAHRRETGKPK